MYPNLLVPFADLITLVGLGCITLIGLRMWIRRGSKLDRRAIADSIREELHDVIRNEVADALQAHKTGLEELHERLDFAERLLIEQRPSSNRE